MLLFIAKLILDADIALVANEALVANDDDIALDELTANEPLVANDDVPNREPVNCPIKDPENEPVFDRNWSTLLAVTITEGIPGCPSAGSASSLTLVSSDCHIIW